MGTNIFLLLSASILSALCFAELSEQNREVQRQMVGGAEERNPNDPQYLQLAEESMQKFLHTSGIATPHRVVSIDRVTYQVVAGELTRINFKISPSAGDGDVLSCLSQIWEQSWMNIRDINVACQINNDAQRIKRQMVGGAEERNPNDPQYIQLAEESMQKFLQTSGIATPHRVVSIDRVTYQVVAGELTRINFKISPSAGDGDVLSCLSQIWEQSWMNIRDINVACQINNDAQRVKRQMVGGAEERNPNDPQYLQLAEESMQKFLHTSGIATPHRVVSIDRVTYQVVAGELTRINFKISPSAGDGDVLSCLSQIWEQSWMNIRDINVACQINNDAQRVKRQMVGGAEERNPNDPQYLQLAEESMQKFLHTSGITTPHRVVSIDRVTYQVVAGELTRINFKISPSAGDGDVLSCLSQIWEQSWMNIRDINVACQINNDAQRVKRQMVGGAEERNPNDPQYLQLAEESMQKFLHTSGIDTPHRVVSIDRVTYQVVAGELTRINFKISPSAGDGDVLSCLSQIWEKSWMNIRDINVACQINNDAQRVKRQMVGGAEERHPNDPQYIQLAEESMQTFLQTSGIATPHRVVSIDRVTYQVVAGELTRINFKISPSAGDGDVLSCLSQVWEQSWMNIRDINVACQIIH